MKRRKSFRTGSRRESWSLPLRFRAPIDPAEFRFCLELGAAAASQKMPMVNPESCEPILLQEENGDTTSILLKNTPINRAFLAIAQHFRSSAWSATDESDGCARFTSVHLRFRAIANVMKHPLAKNWRRGFNGEGTHEAVVDAAATAELNGNGEFDPKQFFELVEKIAAEKYSG
jgi:hypothetical protein